MVTSHHDQYSLQNNVTKSKFLKKGDRANAMAVTLLKNTHKMRAYEQQYHDDVVPTNPYFNATSPKSPNPFAVAKRKSYGGDGSDSKQNNMMALNVNK